MLKSAPGARAPVGLTSSPGGAESSRPRCLPAMMRMPLLRRLRRRAAASSELIGEHLARPLLDGAALQKPEPESAVGQADQPRHRIIEVLEAAAHLSGGPLPQPDLEPGS